MNPEQAGDENPRTMVQGLAAALPAVLVAVLSSSVFVFPPQVLDIYRDIAQYIALGPEDPTIPRLEALAQVWREPTFTIIAALCLAAVLWMAAKSFLGSFRRNADLDLTATRQIRVFLPIVVAVVPILALALGLISA